MSESRTDPSGAQVRCPACGRTMHGGWTQVRLSPGAVALASLLWSDKGPKRGLLGWKALSWNKEVLKEGQIRRAALCEECNSLYIQLDAEPSG